MHNGTWNALLVFFAFTSSSVSEELTVGTFLEKSEPGSVAYAPKAVSAPWASRSSEGLSALESENIIPARRVVWFYYNHVESSVASPSRAYLYSISVKYRTQENGQLNAGLQIFRNIDDVSWWRSGSNKIKSRGWRDALSSELEQSYSNLEKCGQIFDAYENGDYGTIDSALSTDRRPPVTGLTLFDAEPEEKSDFTSLSAGIEIRASVLNELRQCTKEGYVCECTANLIKFKTRKLDERRENEKPIMFFVSTNTVEKLSTFLISPNTPNMLRKIKFIFEN